MPIATKKMYRCQKCGFTMTKIVGDVITPANLIITCPKCGADMEIDFDAEIKDTFFDILKSRIKNEIF